MLKSGLIMSREAAPKNDKVPGKSNPSHGRLVLFSSKNYDREFFDSINNKSFGFEILYLSTHLEKDLISSLLRSGDIVCPFVNDACSREILETLAGVGVKSLVLRSAGYNHVDLTAARELGIRVARVPAYSPYAVAEHTLALVLTLNRKTHRAFNRIREGNFSLENMMGFDLNEKTVGVVGTGKIGYIAAKIFRGFGCDVIAYDPVPNEKLQKMGVRYTTLEFLLAASDIVTLHCPLMPKTHHLIDEKSLKLMKKGVMLINTSRGGLIDTKAAIRALKNGHLGYLGIDVYEEEADLFFEDQSARIIQDDVLMRLSTFPNVLITGHQAFFTREALTNIAEVTLCNARDLLRGDRCPNEILSES